MKQSFTINPATTVAGAIVGYVAGGIFATIVGEAALFASITLINPAFLTIIILMFFAIVGLSRMNSLAEAPTVGLRRFGRC